MKIVASALVVPVMVIVDEATDDNKETHHQMNEDEMYNEKVRN